MFLVIASSVGLDEIMVYASGSGFEYSQYKKTEGYRKNVRRDIHNSEYRGPKEAVLSLCGFVDHQTILEQYRLNQCMLDLTGIAQLSHKPNNYVGNYQCATLEAMCYGCALIKMESTVHPFNCIPREAVVVLPVDFDSGFTTERYAYAIKEALEDVEGLEKASMNAFGFIEQKTDPYALFKKDFLGE